MRANSVEVLEEPLSKRSGVRNTEGERKEGERKEGESKEGERKEGERKEGERKEGEQRHTSCPICIIFQKCPME